jgi:hypothetical protein
MRRRGIAWLGVFAAILGAGAIAFYAPASHPQEPAAKVTLDDQIIYDGPNLGDVPKPDCIEIAPVSAPDSMTPGSWTGVSDTIFSAILARTGIIPGQTDPDFRAPRTVGETTFPGAPGFIENIVSSQVLNEPKEGETGPKGKRMTFGYFVRVSQTIAGKPITREFFLLMSYDYIDAGTPGSNPAAFEVFVFGPLPTPGMYGGADPNALIPLRDGLAVNGSGALLDSVPLNIAMQNNYKGDKVPPNTPVEPGVEVPEKGQPGTGCFACHLDRKGDFPDSSPAWTMTFGQFQAAYQTRTAKIDCPPPASSVLQGNVLQGIGVEPPALAQPNRTGDQPPGETNQQPHTPETQHSQAPKAP